MALALSGSNGGVSKYYREVSLDDIYKAIGNSKGIPIYSGKDLYEKTPKNKSKQKIGGLEGEL
jgi:hypothetical protein